MSGQDKKYPGFTIPYPMNCCHCGKPATHLFNYKGYCKEDFETYRKSDFRASMKE